MPSLFLCNNCRKTDILRFVALGGERLGGDSPDYSTAGPHNGYSRKE
ncbi:MAG TPA: hypothetical protein VGS27_17600 [Candidatus Sulfotelmatobacter sp.]|nr:hypothetical protein [Candidatus Sulfotelmatobacter sp.]